MKLFEIFRFEITYQIRRPSTWLFLLVPSVFAFFIARKNFLGDVLRDDLYLNSPFVVAVITIIASLIWLLLAPFVAGLAATRDVATGVHPLMYTSPVRKRDYLGGRFLAAFTLNALTMLVLQFSLLLTVLVPGIDAAAIGPFRAAAYLTAYAFIGLPIAFFATALQFSFATLARQAKAAYLGSLLIFFSSYILSLLLGIYFDRFDLARFTDAVGVINVLSQPALGWTPLEKKTRLLELQGVFLWNRIVWIGIGMTALAVTYFRFRFEHVTATSWWSRFRRRKAQPRDASERKTISIPPYQQTFDFATHLRQTLLLAWTSFRSIAKSKGGAGLWGFLAFLMVMLLPEHMVDMDVPLLPRTEYVLTFLTAPITDPFSPLILIPLLLIVYAGELVWREREAGLDELTDTTPLPEWVLFAGKYLGLALVCAAFTAILTIIGILVQVQMGYSDFELGLSLRVLFGLQLPEFLLFCFVPLAVHVLVNQKYVAHLVAVSAYAVISLGAFFFKIEHRMLLFGAAPGWSYSDMGGFGSSIGPWLWFKLYWTAWALLIALVATLFWVRQKDGKFAVRAQLARNRFKGSTKWFAAAAIALVLGLGGFVFYNTNILNEYKSASERVKLQAEYEKRYKRYDKIPQPRLTSAKMHVEIDPDEGTMDLRGTYGLVNHDAVPIDSIHLNAASGTGAVTFDRPAKLALEDDDLGYRIYALQKPLLPNESLQMTFEHHVEPRGFSNGGVTTPVRANGTFFSNEHSALPAIGYQRSRELLFAAERRQEGLPARPILPSVYDVEARNDTRGYERIAFEAVVGTTADQIAVAPGALRRSWTKNGRRYFHYVSDAPIGAGFAFFSASYALREDVWKGAGQSVAIKLYHHPSHTANTERMLESVRACLDYHTREFGPYPFGVITLIERPGGFGMNASASMIDYGEAFSRYNPVDDGKDLDLPFAVMAHEMGHQWWGVQVSSAFVEGGGVLGEGLAWFTAMGVVEETYGPDHLRRLRRFFRQPHPIPPIRQSVPLLRGMDPYANYRKGPFAMYALSEYIGKEPVNRALRNLVEKFRGGGAPLPTTLDLYRELDAVTPDSHKYLLHDLWAANTVWELATEQVTAKQTAAGAWQVTLDVKARKVTVDPAGVETEVPMNEPIEIGVFAPVAQGGDSLSKPLYIKKHVIRSGKQTITVTVPAKPARAAIDPRHLLIDQDTGDNYKRATM